MNISVNVDGDYYFVGGIAGYNLENGTITACYNTGDVSGTNYAGGVVGYNGATVEACYWKESSAGQGIGNEPESMATTKVNGTNVKWDMAKSAMNTALSSYGYEYKENNDPMTKEMMPLIIVKSESSN